MVEIVGVVFSTKVVETLILRIDKNGWIQEKSVGIDDQIAVENAWNYESCIQFDELLEVPTISFVFVMINSDLVGKGKNRFVDDDTTINLCLERG
jgi:hypothetical protein